MGTWHVVKQGEWLSKIADQHKITDVQMIWNHSHNSRLKQTRDPNVLFPEDQIYIPDQQPKTVSRGTTSKHGFVIKTPPPVMLHVKVLNADDTPLAGQKFRLTVGEQKFTGITTGEGEVIVNDISVSGEHEGTLDFAEIGLVFPIALGHLNPANPKKSTDQTQYDDGVSGIQMRLSNLGFDPGPIDGQIGPLTSNAVQSFQIMVMQRSADESTGELDSETRDAIIKAHGC